MIEAYAIGVNLSLRGNIGAEIAKVAAQFENLNRIIASSQAAVNGLAAGMRGLTQAGRGAADAWRDAATAMQRAARATREAQSAAQSGGAPSAPAGPRAVPAPRLPLLLTYDQPRTGFTMWNDPALPPGGGSVPLMGPPRLPPGNSGGPGAGALATIPPSGTFPGGPGAPYTPGLPAVIPHGADEPFDGRGPIPLNYTAPRQRPAMPGTHDMMAAAAGFGMLGDAITHFVGGAVKARKDFEHETYLLGQQGFDKGEKAQARDIAAYMQQAVPGITQGDTLHIMRDLLTVTQNRHEALNEELIRSFAQTAVVLNSVGKTDAISELFKAMQGAELRGAFSGPNGQDLDLAKAKAFLANVTATTIQTGGRVGPGEILQAIRSGGMGAAMMSDHELFVKAIVPILSMGASRAGTGIQAFAQQFSAGKMSDAGMAILKEMGMFPNGFNRPDGTPGIVKMGIGQWRIDPELLRGFDDPTTNPRQHPIEFMEKVLLPRIDAYNLKHYGPPKDEQDLMSQRMATGTSITSRIPGGTLLGDVIRNWGMVEREMEAREALLKRTAERSSFDTMQATDPNVKMQAFSAAINGLMIALGGPIMDSAIGAITSITGVLNTLSNLAEAHPDLTRNIMLATAGVGAFSLAMAALSGVFLVAGPMFRITSWLVLSTGMGLLSLGLRTLSAAVSLFGAGTAAGAALLAIPAGFTALAAGLAAVAGPLAAIIGILKLGSDHQSPENEQRQRDNDRDRRTTPPSQLVPQDGFGVDGRPSGRRSSYSPPGRQEPQKVEVHVQGTVDGRTLLSFVAQGLTRSGSGPSGGSTGFDGRAVYSGGMAMA